MIRLIGFLLLATVVGLAAYVYDVKYQTGRLTRQAQGLVREIERERDQIASLRAEWSLLNQPSRLQALAERHLGHLRRFQVSQIGVPHELPDRPLDLGIFLESLASRDPSLNPEVGSPRGATRTPLAAPVPLPRPQAPRR